MATPKKSTDVHFEKTSLSQPSQQIAQEIVRDIMTKRKKKVDPQESKDVEPSKELPKSSSTTSKKPKRQVNITESEMNRLKSRGYTILRQVSKGCSGYIFLATFSRPLKKDVVMACKIIDKNNVEPKFASKFLPRELDILTVLNNPYCVNVFAILEMNSKCFVFMRYAERGDLLTYLTTYGALEEPHARMWIRQLLLGLKYLHSVNIAHRDIKCENILITENLNMKIGDFGFARYWKDEKGHDVLSETFCGSLSYAAPEILSGRKYSMKKCDIWSLGVVLFIMFNLAKPFTKNKAPALLQQQLSRAYKHNPRVERTINTFANDMLYSMLEPDFLLRPSADALLNCLWMKEDPDGYQKHKPRVERTLNLSAKDMVFRMLEPDLLLRPSADALLNSMWMKEDPTLLRLVPSSSNDSSTVFRTPARNVNGGRKIVKTQLNNVQVMMDDAL